VLKFLYETHGLHQAGPYARAQALCELQAKFSKACNLVVPFARDNRCWICNAVKAVADAYKVLKLEKPDDVLTIHFRSAGGVHFDARTYSIKDETVSLYKLTGCQIVKMALDDFQSAYLAVANKGSETGSPG
jgi:hypothetical protein